MLFGGPVETSRGLVLHSADYKRDETLLIDGGMALTASLEILKDMAGGTGPKNAWLALGHSGWAPGQLDREMQDNAWLVVDGDADLVFDADFAAKWQRALDRLGRGGPAASSTSPPSRPSPAAPDGCASHAPAGASDVRSATSDCAYVPQANGPIAQLRRRKPPFADGERTRDVCVPSQPLGSAGVPSSVEPRPTRRRSTGRRALVGGEQRALRVPSPPSRSSP